MSILSVDNISPIGSGTSVTINNAATFVVNNLNASGVTTCGSTSQSFTELQIKSSTSGISELRFADTTVNAGYVKYQHSNNALILATNTEERLRIDSGGGVQVGTSTATASKLTVYGANDAAAIFQGSNTGTGAANGFITGNNGAVNSFVWNYENGFMHFGTNNVERIRIASDGDVGIGTNSPVERVHIHKASATGPHLYITNTSTGVTSGDGVRFGFEGSNNAEIKNLENTSLLFGTNAIIRAYFNNSGHFLPNVNNTYDLGSTALGWRNVYMNDLNLSNMNGDTNDVDGTQGSWTIQEGKDDLYIINRLNGKKFKIKMEEIS